MTRPSSAKETIFTFYGKHYNDIKQMLDLDREIREKFPAELGAMLDELFRDPLQGGSFGGVNGAEWDFEYSPREEAFQFWDKRLMTTGRDSIFFR
jgi:hypothetical protein